MTNDRCATRSRPATLLGPISVKSTARTADWFGRNQKKRRMSTDFLIRDDRSQLRARDRSKKPVTNLRFNIKRLSMQLSHRIGPAMRKRADANLAAFASAFGFAHHSGLWRAQFDNLSRSRQALSGIGIFSGPE
jgi:hypothetical protein